MLSIKQNNWTVDYSFSPSSGLRLGVCKYKGSRVMHAASVPFIYTNYLVKDEKGNDIGPFTDRLKSKTKAIDTRQIMYGFDIKATYDFYGPDYLYEHIWRFHEDGQFGSTIVIHGPGDEINGEHYYNIPFRYNLDISGSSRDSFQQWIPNGSDSGTWVDVLLEAKMTPAALPPASYDWRVIDKATNKAALIRGRDTDNGEIWALQYSDLENWTSWGGTQNKIPGSPGSVPAIYANNQSLQNTDIVIWYIPHIVSHDLATCCGPWFKLMNF